MSRRLACTPTRPLHWLALSRDASGVGAPFDANVCPWDPMEDSSARPLLYVALLTLKSDAVVALQMIPAHIRAEHGCRPTQLVYQIHSDMGQSS